MRLKHLFLFGLILLLASCEKEFEQQSQPDLVENQTKNSAKLGNNIHSYISFSEVPNSIQSVVSDINAVSFDGTISLPADVEEVVTDEIIEFYDIDRKVNTYSFNVKSQAQTPANFYNVVISEFEDGSLTEPIVLQYQMTNEFEAAFLNGEENFNDFDGEITTHSIYEKKDDLVKSSECGGSGVCGGTGGGTGIAAPSSGGSTGSNNTSTRSWCEFTIISIPCTGGGEHETGDHDEGECICHTRSCSTARQGVSVKCYETQLSGSNNCPPGAGGNIGVNTPFPVHDSNQDVAEDIEGQIGDIGTLLGFSPNSNPWRYFQVNSEIRSIASQQVGGCLKSDSEKARDLLDELIDKSSFQQQEELRYLLHKATDSDFTLSESEHKRIYALGYSYNEVVEINSFYENSTSSNRSWLHSTSNSLHLENVLDNVVKYAFDEQAIETIDNHISQLRTDSDYKSFVEASFSWSGVMWDIAKELIGDKAIDLFTDVIGLKDVQDAIKAMKNGDWLEFTVEIGKAAAKNTPLGKLFKTIDATTDMYNFIKKINKLWDRIEAMPASALERVWSITKKLPQHSPLKLNGNYFKYLDDIKLPKFGFASGAPSFNAHWAEISDFYRNKVFKENFPEIDISDMEIHHALPQALKDKFPGFGITPGQMHSIENLRGIAKSATHPVTGGKLHSHITGQWQRFYNDFPNADLDDIRDFAKRIDDDFGHLFIPPVR